MNVVNIKDRSAPGTAPLRNLAALDELALKAIEAPEHLPKMVCFSGPSGFGKSTACGYVAGKRQAYYVEVRSTWTKNALCQALLQQMGIKPKGTAWEMIDQITQELCCSQSPLIFDEFDNAVSRNLVEVVRDIYEQSRSPIILIGEEKLPQKLLPFERFHGRIMEWEQAQPANLDDAKALNRHYAKDIVVEDALLQVLVSEAKGSCRRIVTNLDRIAHFARGEGLKSVSREDWGSRQLHTSRVPAARSF